MPAGIQIFNADGSLQFDIGSRAFRVVTVADVGAASSGTVSADLSQGTVIVGMIKADGKKAPTVTTSPTGASWNYGAIPTGERDTGFQLQLAVY